MIDISNIIGKWLPTEIEINSAHDYKELRVKCLIGGEPPMMCTIYEGKGTDLAVLIREAEDKLKKERIL
jgi:hypothetical protein